MRRNRKRNEKESKRKRKEKSRDQQCRHSAIFPTLSPPGPAYVINSCALFSSLPTHFKARDGPVNSGVVISRAHPHFALGSIRTSQLLTFLFSRLCKVRNQPPPPIQARRTKKIKRQNVKIQRQPRQNPPSNLASHSPTAVFPSPHPPIPIIVQSHIPLYSVLLKFSARLLHLFFVFAKVHAARLSKSTLGK